VAFKPALSREWVGRGVGKSLFLHAIRFYEKMGMYKIGDGHSETKGQPRILPVMEMKLEI
jgi:hypothetical protein